MDIKDHVFISAIDRNITMEMITSGVLAQNTCVGYASGNRQTSYSVNLSAGTTATGDDGCGIWA